MADIFSSLSKAFFPFFWHDYQGIIAVRSSLVIKGLLLCFKTLVFNGVCLFSTVKKTFSNSLLQLLSSLDNLSLNVFLKVSILKDL